VTIGGLNAESVGCNDVDSRIFSREVSPILRPDGLNSGVVSFVDQYERDVDVVITGGFLQGWNQRFNKYTPRSFETTESSSNKR
jgi:radical SAM superfamily enzyme